MPKPARNRRIRVQLPEVVYDALNWHVKAENRTKSDIMRQAIGDYSGRATSSSIEDKGRKKQQVSLTLSLSESQTFDEKAERFNMKPTLLVVCAIIEYAPKHGGLSEGTRCSPWKVIPSNFLKLADKSLDESDNKGYNSNWDYTEV